MNGYVPRLLDGELAEVPSSAANATATPDPPP
jgi:hypothetical protein